MTDRDRLIELLFKVTEEKDCPQPDEIADYLLANGVIVPPCKVGDTVYYITGIYHDIVKSAKVREIILNENGVEDLYVETDNGIYFENSVDIFFRTPEEALERIKNK